MTRPLDLPWDDPPLAMKMKIDDIARRRQLPELHLTPDEPFVLSDEARAAIGKQLNGIMAGLVGAGSMPASEVLTRETLAAAIDKVRGHNIPAYRDASYSYDQYESDLGMVLKADDPIFKTMLQEYKISFGTSRSLRPMPPRVHVRLAETEHVEPWPVIVTQLEMFDA